MSIVLSGSAPQNTSRSTPTGSGVRSLTDFDLTMGSFIKIEDSNGNGGQVFEFES